jgi:hypothetical protein
MEACDVCPLGTVSTAPGAAVCTDCPAGTFALNPATSMRTQCLPCPGRLESQGRQERCCAPFGTCEGPQDPSFQLPYDPASGTCDNRRPKPAGTLCRAQDASQCLQVSLEGSWTGMVTGKEYFDSATVTLPPFLRLPLMHLGCAMWVPSLPSSPCSL